MKRNKNIVPLSQDHHFGLLCSWKIRQGLKKEVDIDRIQKYVDYFWNNSLKQHFKEEEILFASLNDDFTLRVIKEHSDLEKLHQHIITENSSNRLIEFSDLLEKHIRFEERQWFPYLESTHNDSELEEIGAKLNEIHSNEKDNYPDEFWK